MPKLKVPPLKKTETTNSKQILQIPLSQRKSQRFSDNGIYSGSERVPDDQGSVESSSSEEALADNPQMGDTEDDGQSFNIMNNLDEYVTEGEE